MLLLLLAATLAANTLLLTSNILDLHSAVQPNIAGKSSTSDAWDDHDIQLSI